MQMQKVPPIILEAVIGYFALKYLLIKKNKTLSPRGIIQFKQPPIPQQQISLTVAHKDSCSVRDWGRLRQIRSFNDPFSGYVCSFS